MTDSLLMEKRRLMFIKGEDYNFLAYNAAILLNETNASSSERQFKDHRKLAFLVDFVANPLLFNVLMNNSKNVSAQDKQLLSQAYSNGAARMHLMTRLAFALKQRGILSIESQKNIINIFLNPSSLPQGFIANELFKMESQNSRKILDFLPRLRIMNLNSMLQRFFEDYGVKVWHA